MWSLKIKINEKPEIRNLLHNEKKIRFFLEYFSQNLKLPMMDASVVVGTVVVVEVLVIVVVVVGAAVRAAAEVIMVS